MGTQNGHIVPFLDSVSLKKRKRKAMTRIKQIAIMFNIEKFCLLSVFEQKLRSCSDKYFRIKEHISPAKVGTGC